MSVPFLDLKAQYATIRDEVESALRRVVESQHFILGPEVEAFEQEIAAYCGTRFAIGLSSGTDALLAALMAAGVGPGDDVLTSPYTFVATAGVIARLGARPVFVDIDADTFNIAPDQIASRVTPRARAIIPVHLFGRMADMDAITAIARAHELTVIEDAAQAIGAERQGRRAGSIGDMGCFSFYPTKNLGGFGDGGLVTTNDAALAERLKLLRNHGSASLGSKYEYRIIGGNFRLDAIQAAVLRVKLRHLDAWTERRRENARQYAALLHNVDGLQLPAERDGERHVFNQFVARSSRRDALREFLRSRNVGSDVYYPQPLHLAPCFSAFGGRPGDFPESERASIESIALPIYPELTSQMLERVAAAVREGARAG
ncbi:MAG TPA: DegT/DnrJ/EryC1/StrS family aminotransferase [Terriglobia bacterium]|nr:DegT/DnrJ/EryC1/StrS family aminotransferase [Terriglobia bacterium]